MTHSHEAVAANAATVADNLNREAAKWRERAEKAERELDEALAAGKLLVEANTLHFDRAEKAERERDDLAKKVYVPGLWKCAKCGFTLVQRVLRASDGAVGVRDEAGENCPDDGSPLWRVSERDAGNELADRAHEYLERAMAAESERDEARAELEEIETALVAAGQYRVVGDDTTRAGRIAWLKEDCRRLHKEKLDVIYGEGGRNSLRALIARAVEAIEPFNALTPSDADRPDNAVVQIPAYLSELRRLATLAADLRKAREGA